MLKFLQDLVTWLSAFPYAAKVLISAAIVLIAITLVVLIWSSQSKSVP